MSELLGSVGMILSFVSDSFFFYSPHSLFSSFVCRKLQEN